MSYHLETVTEEEAWLKGNGFVKDESGICICYFKTMDNMSIVLDVGGLGRVYSAKVYINDERIFQLMRESAIETIKDFMFDIMFKIEDIANSCNNAVDTLNSEKWVKESRKSICS